MPDPVIRRLPCEATLYVETTSDGMSLSRLIVDVAIPDESALLSKVPASYPSDRGDAWEDPCFEPDPVRLMAVDLVDLPGDNGPFRAEVA